MAGEVRFENREQFEKWLKDKPREVAVVLAARAALRVLPLVVKDKPIFQTRDFVKLASAIFRATALARFVARYPHVANNLHLAAYAAYAASYAPGFNVARVAASAAAYTAYVAGDRDNIDVFATATATAFAASDADSRGATWKALSQDAGLLWKFGFASVADAALWLDGTTDWIDDHWRRLRDALPDTDDWHIWIDWYQRRLNGVSDPEDVELAYVLAPSEDDWKEPARANAAIAARLREIEEGRAPADEVSPEVKDTKGLEAAFDFFLSYNSSDIAFARFVDDVLRKAGFHVFVQFRDMPVGSNFVREMNKGLAAARFVAILSPRYVASKICMDEWSAAYNGDRGGDERRVVQFVVEPANLPPLLNQIVHENLVGLSRDQAARAILKAVDFSGDVTPEAEWPGPAVLDGMAKETRRVFDVEMTAKGRLAPKHIPINDGVKDDYGGFPADALYADARYAFSEFADHVLDSSGGNFAFPTDVKKAAQKLLQATPEALASCAPLRIERALAAAMRALDNAESAGDLPPKHDMIHHHRVELRGIYQRLAAIFLGLHDYREKARGDRFVAPGEDASRAQNDILEKTAADTDVATPELAEALRETLEAITSAEESVPPGASEETRRRIIYDALKAAAAQIIPVSNYIVNAGAKVDKTASGAARTVENLEKLAKKLGNAKDYFDWLREWWY